MSLTSNFFMFLRTILYLISTFCVCHLSQRKAPKATENLCHLIPIWININAWHANSLKLFLQAKKEVTTVEDPFDSPTYHIPEKPVTFTEGASYSLVILAGLGVAGAAGYGVFKELIFQPKEWEFRTLASFICSDTCIWSNLKIQFCILGTRSLTKPWREFKMMVR